MKTGDKKFLSVFDKDQRLRIVSATVQQAESVPGHASVYFDKPGSDTDLVLIVVPNYELFETVAEAKLLGVVILTNRFIKDVQIFDGEVAS